MQEREPFSIAPDPRYLFMSERHREALAHLLYGVRGGGGFVLLTGEIGAGKTTVCRCFLEQVPKRCNVAYIFNPKLTALELLQSVCEEFRIEVHTRGAAQATLKDHVDSLNEFLLRTHAAGHTNVLIGDAYNRGSASHRVVSSCLGGRLVPVVRVPPRHEAGSRYGRRV